MNEGIKQGNRDYESFPDQCLPDLDHDNQSGEEKLALQKKG